MDDIVEVPVTVAFHNDRVDIARDVVTMHAPQHTCPHLMSINGNSIAGWVPH